MKSWKTTLFGALAAVSAGLTTVLNPEWRDILVAIAAVFGALAAYFAKDGNVTGGSVQ